jgi:hypothetical protein
MPGFLIVFFKGLSIFNFDILSIFDSDVMDTLHLSDTLQPFNDQAEMIGIETSSFMINGLEIILMLLYAILSVAFVYFLVKNCFTKKKSKVRKKLKAYLGYFKYTFFIRLVIETYLTILLSVFIGFYHYG